MKKLILLLILAANAAFGQTQPPTQVFNGVLYQYKNSLRVDSNLFLPRRDTAAFNAALHAPGNIRWRPADSSLYYYRGDKWGRVAQYDDIPAAGFPSSLYGWTNTSTDPTDYARDGNKVAHLGDYLFSFGGWNNNNTPVTDSQVYRINPDLSGATQLAAAPWERRHTFGFGQRGDSVYVFGGDPFGINPYQKDSWVGWLTGGNTITWALRNSNVPWGERILFGSCIHNGALFVIGGQESTTFSDGVLTDVWKSTDGGINWTQIATGLTQFGKNIVGGVVSFNGYIYVIGGGQYDQTLVSATYDNQVWRSKDGITWEQLPDGPWLGRQYMDCAVHDGKIFMITGSNAFEIPNPFNLNDCWTLDINNVWERLPDLPNGRHASGVASYGSSFVVVCGNLWNDIWKLGRTQTDSSYLSYILNQDDTIQPAKFDISGYGKMKNGLVRGSLTLSAFASTGINAPTLYQTNTTTGQNWGTTTDQTSAWTLFNATGGETNVIYVTPANNFVGLGNIGPAYKLDVTGQMRASGMIGSQTGLMAGFSLLNNDGTMLYTGSNNKIYPNVVLTTFQHDSTNTAADTTAGIEFARVGHESKSFADASNSNGMVKAGSVIGMLHGVGATQDIGAAIGGTSTGVKVARIGFWAETDFATNTLSSANIRFYTKPNTQTTLIERARFKANGDVWIGETPSTTNTARFNFKSNNTTGNAYLLYNSANKELIKINNAGNIDFTGMLTLTGTGYNSAFSPSLFLANTTASTGRIWVVNSDNTGLYQVADVTGGNLTRQTINSLGYFGVGGTAATSMFHVKGSFAVDPRTVTGDITLDASHCNVAVNNSANQITTLPAVSDCPGREYTVVKISNNAFTVTIDGSGAETINGATTYVLTAQYNSITFWNTGTQWVIK